jgi:hypothetical protein
MQTLVPAPDTTGWYRTQYGCLRNDPTRWARMHTFSDAVIPDGIPEDPAASSKICLQYRTAWPMGYVSDAEQEAMVQTEMSHPQFAFRATVGGPATVRQVDVESQLRRLDQPLGHCQAELAPDAPLYRNTVAPPVPPPGAVPVGVQNAGNPIAVIVRGPDACRSEADAVASAMSGRWLNNPTRQDTARMVQPFAPPGVGSGTARGPGAGAVTGVYYS